MKLFYQGEVLVPEGVPPHLIRFPTVDAFNRPLAPESLDGRLLVATSEKCSVKENAEDRGCLRQHRPIAAGTEHIEETKDSHEIFVPCTELIEVPVSMSSSDVDE